MKNRIDGHFVPLEESDSGDDLDLSKAVAAPPMPELKFSSQRVTVRLPASLMGQLKTLANRRDVPYQSLMKILLAQAVDRELNHEK